MFCNMKTYEVPFEIKFILLFYYVPFMDSDYVGSNGRMIIEWWIGKNVEAVVAYFKILSNIYTSKE
jgi:hypothetical protein